MMTRTKLIDYKKIKFYQHWFKVIAKGQALDGYYIDNKILYVVDVVWFGKMFGSNGLSSLDRISKVDVKKTWNLWALMFGYRTITVTLEGGKCTPLKYIKLEDATKLVAITKKESGSTGQQRRKKRGRR